MTLILMIPILMTDIFNLEINQENILTPGLEQSSLIRSQPHLYGRRFGFMSGGQVGFLPAGAGDGDKLRLLYGVQ
jgi:hypothetical protein